MRALALAVALLLLVPDGVAAGPADAARDVAAARRLLEAGRARDARDRAAALAAQAPGSPAPLELLAEAHYALAERERLRAACERLTAGWPERPLGYALAARVLVDEGDVPGAVALYRRLLRARPDDVASRLVLASLLRWQASSPASAAAEYERARALAATGSAEEQAAEVGRAEALRAGDLRARLRGHRRTLDVLLVGLVAAFVALFLVLLRTTRQEATAS